MCQGFLIRSVVSCVDVSGLQHPTTFTQKTFNGPLHVYFGNTHAHERSLREVNKIKGVPPPFPNTRFGANVVFYPK